MTKEDLVQLISEGLSIRAIAKKVGKSQGSIRFHLKKYGLKTNASFYKNEYRCKYCGETNAERFVYRTKNRLCKSVCLSCHNDRAITRIRQLKQKAVEYKGCKCEICGYSECVGSLHFHHRDPDKKDPKWTLLRRYNWPRLRQEIDKCMLVCANCHGEIHWGRSLTG